MKKGEIWVVNIPVTDGHEQYGTRPVIILGDTPSSVVVGIPCTTNLRALRFPYTVSIPPSEHNGLTQDSIALVLQIRAIDKKRLHQKIGEVETALVPCDVRPSQAIVLDDPPVSSHALPQRHIHVARRRV